MHFNDIVGQQATKQHLVEMLQQNRLSHALLFLGKEGSGALPLALAFSQLVSLIPTQGVSAGTSSLFGEETVTPLAASLPSSPQEADEWQKGLQAYQKASLYIHPDIHFSYPVIPKKPGEKPTSADYAAEWREFLKQQPYGNAFDWLQFLGAENKQGNITAEECNEIIRKISLKSYESDYKILVMWMPEYLGKEGNKLLKLIEEPPGKTLFIFVAENDEQILPTILSRCQVVKLPPLSTAEIEQALVLRTATEPQLAHQTACIADGNYREALQILQHAGEDWHALLKDWLNVTLQTGGIFQVRWIEEMNKQGREKQKQFLKYFTHVLHQCMHLRIMNNAPSLTDNEKELAAKLNVIATVSQQSAIIEELNNASYYIERNANAKMLFHALTIKLNHIIKDKTVFLTT